MALGSSGSARVRMHVNLFTQPNNKEQNAKTGASSKAGARQPIRTLECHRSKEALSLLFQSLIYTSHANHANLQRRQDTSAHGKGIDSGVTLTLQPDEQQRRG